MTAWSIGPSVLCIRQADHGFSRWPCSCQPQSQVLKDGPDHLSVFDETDDQHGPKTPWADQGVNFVGFSYQTSTRLRMKAFEFPCGSRMQGMTSSVPASFRFPRETLL